MRANSFGRYFGFTCFGDSHGPAMGLVIEDVKANIDFPFEELKKKLSKRKPGQSFITTSRTEDDSFEVISGLYEGKTTGMPICIIFKNKDSISKDYENIKDFFRPGHSDYSWFKKFKILDYRGGGRASGRETISRVAAGAFVEKTLGDIKIISYPIKIGKIKANKIDLSYAEKNILYWPDPDNYQCLINFIQETKQSGDTVGAIIEVKIYNVPAGLGDPVFEKLDANIAKAILGIGGVKGIEFGDGFAITDLFGSQSNDQQGHDEGNYNTFYSNHQGGIAGGVSNSNIISFNVAVKAVSSISKPQKCLSKDFKDSEIVIKGRHDVCLIPRILPVIESMLELVLADAIAYQKLISSEKLSLTDYREMLEKIDEDIILALYRRFEVVDKIGEYKKVNRIAVHDEKREQSLIEKMLTFADDLNLSKELISEIWNLIFAESKKRQAEL